MSEEVKVLYIGGAGRSGTTLLNLMLGQVDGLFAAGEVTYIWDRGVRQNQLCGCGLPFSDCEFWNAVIREGFGTLDQRQSDEFDRLRKRLCRTSCIPQLHYRSLRSRRFQNDLDEYSKIMTTTFRAIQKVSGCKAIVDSSKYPAEAYLLQTMPEVELSLAHMVRHVMGVVHSWQRKKVRTEIHWRTELFPRYHPFITTMAWLVYNEALRRLSRRNERYKLIRYEDLIQDSKSALRGLAPLVDEFEWDLGFIEENQVSTKPNHTVTGNPMRFQTGKIDLSPDLEWQSKASLARTVFVNSLAWPQIWRYGYYSTDMPRDANQA